jgi:hypothetical protein
MRPAIRFSALLLGLALMAGCQGGLPFSSGGGTGPGAGAEAAAADGAGLAAEAIEVTPLDAPGPESPADPAAAKLEGGEAAVQDAAGADAGEPEAAPASEAAAPDATAGAGAAAVPELTEPPPEAVKTPGQIACEKKRGRYVKVGDSYGYTCVQATRDGGKSCRKAGDCQGLCLARSMSCSPFTPLLGCHEILQQDGARVMQCID